MRKIHKLWLVTFLSNCQKLNKSEHTIKNYRCDLEKFIYWFEAIFSKNLNKANARTIEQYKDYLAGVPFKTRRPYLNYLFFWKKPPYPKLISQKALSIGSKKRHLSAIKNFYEYLIQANEGENRLFSENPVKNKLHSIRLKDADINHTRLLTPAHWDNFEKELKTPREMLIGYLLYYGGLRLEELTRLKVENFSQRNKSLTFIRKGGQLHSIKLQEFDLIFHCLVKTLGNSFSEDRYIFLNRFGFPISSRSMYQTIKKLLVRSGLGSSGLSPHSFRKACATNMYKLSKDILQVRNYLNHKDAQVTQTYIEY